MADKVTLDDIMDTTLRNNAKAMADKLLAPSWLNELLYGDDIPWSERSTWFKFKYTVARYCRRVRDAWLVLVGEAFVE